MTNPIDNGARLNTGVNTVRGQAPAAGKSAENSEAGAKAPAAPGAESSERLQLVRERIDSTPEVDMSRVEAIKQKIAEGQYPIDAERVAEKFLQLEGLLRD